MRSRGFSWSRSGLLLKRRADFTHDVLCLVVGGIVLALAAELIFTLYSGPYQGANMAGHLVNLLSFYMIYQAIVVTGGDSAPGSTLPAI